MSFWRARPDGVTVMVKVQPRARRSGLGGIAESASGPRLKIAVTEPAEGGKANRAVCALLAEALCCPPSAVGVLSGATNREKVLAVSGDAVALGATLRAL
jgi:uncharacterized protein